MATDPMKELFNLAKQEIASAGEYSAVEKLKACGLEHDKSCSFVETVILHESGYFSLSARLKRVFGAFDIKDVHNLFIMICEYLLSSGHYDSQTAIDEKIADSEKTLEKLEEEFNSRDDLYYYSSHIKRKVIILNNLHFSDFSISLQNKIISLLGREKIMKSIDGRTKNVINKVNTLGENL